MLFRQNIPSGGADQLAHLRLQFEQMVVLHVGKHIPHHIRQTENIFRVQAGGTHRGGDLPGYLSQAGRTGVLRIRLVAQINDDLERFAVSLGRMERDLFPVVAAALALIQMRYHLRRVLVLYSVGDAVDAGVRLALQQRHDAAGSLGGSPVVDAVLVEFALEAGDVAGQFLLVGEVDAEHQRAVAEYPHFCDAIRNDGAEFGSYLYKNCKVFGL